MNNVAIPNWNPEGALPPINLSSPTSVDRSPYVVSLTDIVLRFGNSAERQAIINGFLKFRSALHEIGLVNGFQWLNGSFLEHIEMIEERSPRDMDVVTFFHLPKDHTQETLLDLSPRLFNPINTKEDYHVDAYFVQLSGAAPEPLVGLSAYWYSMWSHRRNGQWKGYLQVDLSQTEDTVARINLDKMVNQGGNP